MPKIKLHWQILIALGLAVATGLAASSLGGGAERVILAVCGFIGDLFLRALKMLIVPLIAASMVTGMASVGGHGHVGRLGGKTFLYYMGTSTLAILIGLLAVNLIQPGIIGGQPARDLIGLGDGAQAAQSVAGRGAGDVVAVFQRMIPTNIVAAAAEGQMLGLIFFSLIFGYFLSRARGRGAKTLGRAFQGLFDVMMKITDLVMRFAPLGVFGLVAKVVAGTGFEAFRPLTLFFFTVLGALALHFFVALPLLLKWLGRVVRVGDHYRAMAPALLTAFSTSSSSATLPTTMRCVEKNAGVSNSTSSFVLPLGATVNMDGTALYECVAALFIAQAYGLQMGFALQFTVVWIALVTSIGVAGIPAASLVAIVLILTSIGLPAEGIGLILAVDRILDMARTATNVFSDSCGAVILARSEGEKVGYPMEG